MTFSIGFFIFYFLIFSVLLWLWIFRKKEKAVTLVDLPKVSILIAARNEEANILNCLAAIHHLNYPKEKLEVLVGDDRSSDKTHALVQSVLLDRPYVQLFSIEHTLPGTQGKANVLAQLANKATSNYFFITDADIEVPATWVNKLLSQITGNVAIVTGITTTKGPRLFDRLQALDWLFSLGLMQVVSDRGLPASTMGNNMLVSREAYEKVGGFGKIPFSITEDVQLFKEIVGQGYKTKNVYSAEALALSEPSPTFLTFLQQRRRWMRGSMQLPWYLLLLLLLHSAYYPIWAPFFLHTSWFYFLMVFFLKMSLQFAFVFVATKRVGWKSKGWEIILFEFYLLVTSLILIVYFFIPVKINWKGRQY